MSKELNEMSLEELWQLFPIILKEHNSDYFQWFKEEENSILKELKDEYIERINHIGSSSVEGLIAKPTVDILLELKVDADIQNIKDTLKRLGWGLMSSQDEPYLHLVFNKGYTKDGFAEKVYHLHVRYGGDWKELYFRDYLREHEDVAKAYGDLKLGLIDEYRNNRDGYTESKTEFISKYTEIAMREYTGRYEMDNLKIYKGTK